MIKPQTLKGFRDFLPEDARKRQYVIQTVKDVYECYGFSPLETPVLEYEEILTGKYGDEGDKLMYRFEDNGKRKVAMRYDQTVPLARVIAQYQNELPMPFKRYQIQNVWRAENTQRGRFREFLQCDADIIGSNSALADAEIIQTAYDALKKLGFDTFKILINDRSIFSDISNEVVLSIDKLKKIQHDGVIDELVRKGLYDKQSAEKMLRELQEKAPTPRLVEVLEILSQSVPKEYIHFTPTLARGLDYYTGLIFEIEVDEYPVGSVCGGGRYDNLIGMFMNNTNLPAVGFAFGFDRVIEAMNELNLFPQELHTTKVLVTIFSKELQDKSLEITAFLRTNNINTELYLPTNNLDQTIKMDKQLKYADRKKIPYVVIIGPDESAKNVVQLKNLQTREQKEVSLNELIKLIA